MFAMAALVPWTFFMNSLLFAVPSFLSVTPILLRLSFPRAAIPLSMVGASLIDLLVSALIFVIFAFTIGNGLPATAAWFPLLVIIELFFVTGIVLLGSAMNVFARDVRLAIPVAAQLLLFVTPVMYPLSLVPHRLRPLFVANPLTGLVESFRRVLVYGRAPQPGTLMPAIIGAAVAFVIGTWYLASTESRFADVV
jgi:lipopolysaccharide transport system permease protein